VRVGNATLRAQARRGWSAVSCRALGRSLVLFKRVAREATLRPDFPRLPELQGMPQVMRVLHRGHDPYWGVDGKNVTRERRLRRLLELTVALAVIALLLVVFKPLGTIGAIGELIRYSPPPSVVLAWPGVR
jgi:hypothetical protein